MRTTQFIGLRSNAIEWLHSNCKCSKVVTCSSCGHTTGGKLLSHDQLDDEGDSKIICGMLGEDIHTLQYYELNNGKGYIEEYIQAEPWSSGPCIFLALRASDTKEPIIDSLWDNEDIGNC